MPHQCSALIKNKINKGPRIQARVFVPSFSASWLRCAAGVSTCALSAVPARRERGVLGPVPPPTSPPLEGEGRDQITRAPKPRSSTQTSTTHYPVTHCDRCVIHTPVPPP